MPFDLTTWKTTVRKRLTHWRHRLREFGVDSVYGGLCAMTLWPVAAAVKSGDLSAVIALAGVAGGVGANLVANRIQQWEDEVDAAHQLAREVATEPDLRAALDTILQTLETVALAQHGSSAEDKQWLLDTLRQELERYGTSAQTIVTLTGPGAIATTGGVAAGAGAVAVGGDVHGNIYVGPRPRDPAQALAIYRRVVVDSCRQLSLRGLDVGASDPTSAQQRLDLVQVYVDLLTTTQVPVEKTTEKRRRQSKDDRESEGETRPLNALAAVHASRRLVLLGDPGSGKSTFLTHLALCLAAQSLEPQHHWLQRLSGWSEQEADIVPIVVTLRDFARWVPETSTKADPAVLWGFIAQWLAGKNLTFAGEPLLDRLERGQAILLLDGLDEIPTQPQRAFVRAAVESFARRYPDCRFVVTCRTLSYQDPAWQLHEFHTATLAPFSAEQIDLFIAAWYGELARFGRIKPEMVAGGIRLLQEAVRRPDLWRLAANPLLLTAMALVHTHKGRLPEARALLYEETIEILLWRWEQVKVSGTDDPHRLRHLLILARRTDVDLKRVLRQLAFTAHQGAAVAGEGVADITESQLEQTLRELHPDRSKDWAGQVIAVMKERAGLLLERAPGVYTFPHRTFQEYLAGAHLAAQPDFARQGAHLATEGALWREVLLLAVGRLVYRDGDTAKPLALVAELCPAQPNQAANAWWQVWVAGDVLLEMGRNRAQDSALGRELVERVSHRLVELLQGSHLSPVERAAAGDTLARLGDPRFRADAWFLPDEPLLGFIEIPAGPFLMGSDQQRDSQAYEAELPQRPLTLPRYYIARYPVTVAQFRAFVEQSGHQPQDENSLAGLVNHPVASITWHDALRYCEWLTECLRQWQGTPEPLATLLKEQGWQVTLPSEAEWEKAARGTDGRIYPWGNEFDAAKANMSETGIGRLSAVGCFSQGASPSGCLDMVGNVLEWTRSEDGVYPYPTHQKEREERENLQAGNEKVRVLRGGSFWDYQWGVRCAYRFRRAPSARRDDIGVRVVVRP